MTTQRRLSTALLWSVSVQAFSALAITADNAARYGLGGMDNEELIRAVLNDDTSVKV